MNLELTEDELHIVETVRVLLVAQPGDRAAEDADGTESSPIDRLAHGGFLDVASRLGLSTAGLIVEEVGFAAVDAPVAAHTFVAPACRVSDPPLWTGLMSGNGALVRYGSSCELFICADGDTLVLANRDDVRVESVADTRGYPYARVWIERPTRAGSSAMLWRSWQVAIAAEAAGAMAAAIDCAVRHVSIREQFGQPIAAFQAVRHKLATALIFASGTQWLARRAAAHLDDGYLAACAAAHASTAARSVYLLTHQVCGATGLTTEFGLTRWTSRLIALGSELGGAAEHSRQVLAHRSAQRSHATTPLPPS